MIRSNQPASCESQSDCWAAHPRHFQDNTYVYPVISRRSGGLSVGINLNPDGLCNFDCTYCQVDRTVPRSPQAVDLAQVERELVGILKLAASGAIWADPTLSHTPLALRRVNDIAFSGDGEPTASPCFPEAVAMATRVKSALGLDKVRLVVITNATLLTKPAVDDALTQLASGGGEIWAKLDAGDEVTYRQINRSAVPFASVLKNILHCGQRRRVIIQTMLMTVDGEALSDKAFASYLDRLEALAAAGCRIDRVQLYSVARRTADPRVGPVDPVRLEIFASAARQRVGDRMAIEVYPGVTSAPKGSPS